MPITIHSPQPISTIPPHRSHIAPKPSRRPRKDFDRPACLPSSVPYLRQSYQTHRHCCYTLLQTPQDNFTQMTLHRHPNRCRFLSSLELPCRTCVFFHGKTIFHNSGENICRTMRTYVHLSRHVIRSTTSSTFNLLFTDVTLKEAIGNYRIQEYNYRISLPILNCEISYQFIVVSHILPTNVNTVAWTLKNINSFTW